MRVVEQRPDSGLLISATNQILSEYPHTRPPQGFRGEEFNEEIIRKRCVWFMEREIPKDSKPGVPYSVLGSCNKDILPANSELLCDLVVERLNLLATHDCSEYTAEQIVQLGLADPVRVFVKNEPHSTRKVNQQRWRMIFAVSVVDQLIERLICSEQNKREIATWQDHPSAPGIGLSDDAQLEQFFQRVLRKLADGAGAEADVTGWDWSVKEWELLHEAEMRIKLGNFGPQLSKIIRNRFYAVSRSVYAMPSGELIVLKIPGVQLSGCYNTSSTNSRLRVLVAYLVGANWAFAMGDDCVEEYVPNARELYALMGHSLKMYERRVDRFEFCSQLFTSDGVWPVDGTKTLYRLLEQKQITPELVAQFRMEMRNSPRLHEFLTSVSRVRDKVGNLAIDCNATNKTSS